MYFWRIEHLKAKLVRSPLTDREVLPYLVVYLALSAMVGAFPLQTTNSWDKVSGVISVGCSVLGPIYVYRKNEKGGYFLQRFFSLGWVVFIRLVSVFIPIFFGTTFLIALIYDVTEETQWYNVLLLVIAQFLLYSRLGREVGDVSRRAAQHAAAADR